VRTYERPKSSPAGVPRAAVTLPGVSAIVRPVAAPATFDFITDEQLRESLQSDYQELQSAEGILSDKAADLSSVIRGYRNLIHPGRVLRLGETVDEEGARIAEALVSLIVREIGTQHAEVYGPTAEQLLAKFESDASVLAISDHLLRDTKQGEIERLLPVRSSFATSTSTLQHLACRSGGATNKDDIEESGR
jgi:hypothetical protein